VKVVAGARLRLTIACSVLPLVACGSGDLGRIPAAVSAVPPPSAAMPSSAPDAGSTPAASQQGACGDGVIQAARIEQCEGENLGGYSCEKLGLGSGALSCDPVTCQLVTAQCVRDAGSPPMAAGSSGSAGSAVVPPSDAGMPVDAGLECPTGFTCATPIVGRGGPVCMTWGEEGPPECFTVGGDTDCVPALPGSTCTATNLGLFCMLPCTP
jgi:hypothetical protein